MQSVKIRAVGDMMFGDSHVHIGSGVRGTCRKRGYDFPFSELKNCLLDQGPLLFGNLESVETSNKGFYRHSPYIGDIEILDVLSKHGFTVLNLANNHILEYGSSPAVETVERLKDLGISSVGYPMNDHFETVISYQGCSIVFLSFSMVPLLKHNLPVSGIDQIHHIVELNAREYDLVVVSLHWGAEFVVVPSRAQVLFARKLIDAGARVILGHHPHVVQPVEYYGDGIIAYSLGNFVFDMPWLPLAQESMILTLDIPVSSRRPILATITPVQINDVFQPVPYGGNVSVEHFNKAIESRWGSTWDADIPDDEYSVVSYQCRANAGRLMWRYVARRLLKTRYATFRYFFDKQLRKLSRDSFMPREKIDSAWRLV